MRLILPADGAHLPLIIKRIAVNLFHRRKNGHESHPVLPRSPEFDIGQEHGIQRKSSPYPAGRVALSK